MDLQFKLNLPYSGWEYIPLPIVATKSVNQYEIVFKLQLDYLPAFVASLINNFGVSAPPQQQSGDRTIPTEHPFVSECRQLIESGSFELCEEGVGGTYFVKNKEGTTIAVFKPDDEEPGAPNNPKNIVQSPILPPGGGSVRELAAYLLDTDHFAGVPETFMLSKVHHKDFFTDGEKSGSLQRFIKNDGLSSDVGCSKFSVEDVHRIGVLDVRIFNLDRNGENLLTKLQDSDLRLIPIDHTYSLPPVTSLDNAYFEWHYWPQAKKPFSPETLEYIENINIQNDLLTLQSLGLPKECIWTMLVSTTLLKEAASCNLTLFDIASFMSRKPATEPSKLEELVNSCLCEDVENFLLSFRKALRSILSSFPKP